MQDVSVFQNMCMKQFITHIQRTLIRSYTCTAHIQEQSVAWLELNKGITKRNQQ
jgi:hypothetical protein